MWINALVVLTFDLKLIQASHLEQGPFELKRVVCVSIKIKSKLDIFLKYWPEYRPIHLTADCK
jgi:hypothetical protein